VFNDIAVAARTLQREGAIDRALVVDLDVHRGDGTAAIFAGDPSVFTFSCTREELFPSASSSSLDVELDGCRDPEIAVAALERTCPQSSIGRGPTWCSSSRRRRPARARSARAPQLSRTASFARRIVATAARGRRAARAHARRRIREPDRALGGSARRHLARTGGVFRKAI
jgi:hypothetical protein